MKTTLFYIVTFMAFLIAISSMAMSKVIHLSIDAVQTVWQDFSNAKCSY